MGRITLTLLLRGFHHKTSVFVLTVNFRQFKPTWLCVTLLSRVDQILSISVAITGSSSPSSESQSIARVQKVEEREAVTPSITSSASTLRGNKVQQGGDDVGIIPGGIAGTDVEEEICPHQVNVVQTCRKTTFSMIFINFRVSVVKEEKLF